MANYMTQKMSHPKCIPITYYRMQSTQHVSHVESGAFTQAAKTNYSTFNNVPPGSVEEGKFQSGQGVPTGGKTYQI